MMSYTAHERNGDMLLRDQTNAAIQSAMDEMNPRKRKRDMTELEAGGPQSGSKRGSTSNMNGTGSTYMDSLHHSSNSNDFSNLTQQLQAANNSNHGLPSTNASSTAAAALAGIMPQMTIPQPTHLSFASEVSNADGDRQFDSSFDMSGDSGHGHNGQGAPYNLNSFPGTTAAQVEAARESSNGGGNKPSVGSDEWHKVRRDNHKEGKHSESLKIDAKTINANSDRQSSDDVAKPSTKASTSSPRSSPAAKRTKVQYYSVRSSTSTSLSPTKRRTLSGGRRRAR